jgi:hypothetical protein
VPPRYFTPEKANESLAEIRPLTARLVEHRRALLHAQARRAALAEQIAGNGGGIQPSDLAEADADVERETTEVAACMAGIDEAGALVKDLDRGLVDFPALHRGREVLLCWQLGEDEVAHWHGSEDGFAGRRPLPLD